MKLFQKLMREFASRCKAYRLIGFWDNKGNDISLYSAKMTAQNKPKSRNGLVAFVVAYYVVDIELTITLK
jgi:hypothetical protein